MPGPRIYFDERTPEDQRQAVADGCARAAELSLFCMEMRSGARWTAYTARCHTCHTTWVEWHLDTCPPTDVFGIGVRAVAYVYARQPKDPSFPCPACSPDRCVSEWPAATRDAVVRSLAQHPTAVAEMAVAVDAAMFRGTDASALERAVLRDRLRELD